MALDAATAQALIQKLDLYTETVNKNTELLLQAISANHAGPSRHTALPEPPPRLTADTLRRNTIAGIDVESFQKTASFAGTQDSDGDDDSSDAGISLFASSPLKQEEYTIEDLKDHIRCYNWTDEDKKILSNVLENPRLLVGPSIFPTDIDTSDDRSHFTHYTILDVADNGVLSEPLAERKPVSRSWEIWSRLCSTNADPDDTKKAVGRITILREPSPLLFAALHLTMHKHFDMDEIFGFLVDDDPGLVRPHNPFSKDDRHRRTFVWNAEYFTIIGENCMPMPWQRSDMNGDGKDTAHVPITRCSAMVALAFEGEPLGRVKNKDRRSSRRIGYTYDPFSPWRVLAIQAYPDWQSTIEDDDDMQKHKPVNGPEAFLNILRQELRDAAKRLLEVHKRVEDLVRPPDDFIFSQETRDKLLFEDHSYTLSRRYFWASQTLTIMNQDIEEMIESFRETFTDEVWNGTHKFIWPSSNDPESSSRDTHFRKRMALLRRSIDEELLRLQNIERMNAKEIKKIKALREELFSGTSVQESRKSVELAGVTVEQGHNIRVLTLVTIFFTPAMFVTGVYGMTNMNPNDPFYHFAITFVAICLPTYLLVLHVNTMSGRDAWTRIAEVVSHYTGVATAKFWKALLGHDTAWTKRYLDPPSEDQPLPPGRTRHKRTLSSSSMDIGLRSRGRHESIPLTPPISRTITKENGDGSAAMTLPKPPTSPPVSPLGRAVTWDLEELVPPEQMAQLGGLQTPERKSGLAVEQEEDIRDVEEPFPATPQSKTFIDRLRGRRKG